MHPGEAEDAKNGAVVIAAKTGAPIVPVYLKNTGKVFRVVTICFGEPFYVERAAGAKSTQLYNTYTTRLIGAIRELEAAL